MIKIDVIVPLCMPMCGANDQEAKPLGAANVTGLEKYAVPPN